MELKRIWVIGAIALLAAIVLGGWTVGIQPQLTAMQAAGDEQVSVEAANAASAAKLAALKKDYQNLPAVKQQRDDLREQIPTDAAIAPFVDELDAIADSNGVSIRSIGVDDAQPYTAPAAAAKPAATTGAATSAAAGASAAGGAAPAGAAVAPVDARITAANFSAIQIRIAVTGKRSNVLNFVHGVQAGKRLFLVTGFSSAKSSTGGSAVEAAMSGYAYALLPTGQPAATTSH